ncbi:MAG TPA: hypothetical protein VG345_16630 [Bryobacteraceae bacterium]|nr:hypothetical protein [Bryobacteraceae bacterium]
MPGVLEVITQGAYDYYEVAAATAVAAQILFTIPRGGQYTPTGGSAFTKQKYHTNLTQAGQLSAPSKLMVKGLTAYLRSDIASTDYNLFSGNSLVTFQVDQKDYLNIVLAKLPGGGGGSGFASFAQAAAASQVVSSISNGWPEANALYALEGDGVQIEQQQNFAVVIDPTQVQAGAFTTAAAAGLTFGNGVKLIFTLEGLFSRAVL